MQNIKKSTVKPDSIEDLSNGQSEEEAKLKVSESQNKAIRLFTFLEKSLAISDSIVRDFRTMISEPSPWWLADFPRDVENLVIRDFETGQNVNNTELDNTLLRVEKIKIKQVPALPKELLEWVEDITPLELPSAKEKVDRKVKFDTDKERVKGFKLFRESFQQGDKVPEALTDWVILSPSELPKRIEYIIVEDKWGEHPELQKLLTKYIENDWKAWSEEVQKVYKANLLYDQLYALRLLLKNEGDSYELLLGHGILTWKHKAAGTIFAPIFLTPLVLDFDASKGTIELSPDPMFRNYVEISSLLEMDNSAEMDLVVWSDSINADPFDFWLLESLKLQIKTVLNYVSSDNENCFTDTMKGEPDVSDKPGIWNTPVVFVRKRTNDFWSKYSGAIRRDIEQNNILPTEFIMDLIGEYKTKSSEGVDEEETEHVSELVQIDESELFFPLPWNDEQKRIAERLETSYGMVVKGPPGTGKSHTIANLVARFLAQGKSVLVTSQTSKALEVLRDKLPENIRSLVVSQLQQTKHNDILQQSISEINSNLGERDTKFSDIRIELIRKELSEARRGKALLAKNIQEYILADSSEKIEIDGEEVKPMKAAEFISQYLDDKSLDWFTDTIPFEASPSFSDSDLKQLYELLLEVEPENRNLFLYELPDLSFLPNQDIVLSKFATHKDLSEKSKKSAEVFNDTDLQISREALIHLHESLLNAQKVLQSVSENYEKEIFELCSRSKNEQEKWNTVISKVLSNIETIAKGQNSLLGHEVQGELSMPLSDIIEGLELLKVKVSGKTKLGKFDRLLLSSNAKKILESYVIDGKNPDCEERVGLLCDKISCLQAEKEIIILLDQGFSTLNDIPKIRIEHSNLVELETIIKSLDRIVKYTVNFAEIDSYFKSVRQLENLNFINLSNIEESIDIISSYLYKMELSDTEKTFSDWLIQLENISRNTENCHSIIRDFIDAIKSHNVKKWKDTDRHYNILVDKKKKAILVHQIGERIGIHCPNLLQNIIDLADQRREFECPKNLSVAWKCSRLESWLKYLHDRIDIDFLQKQFERLSMKEFDLNSELVTVLAWQRQIDKVTKQQRDALCAWADSMKKYGKGKGKYAPRWLHSAQEALKEAKNAVPVWIMPLHRVVQMFPEPKPGMFDVVIFDEASQCDMRGITIGYLGKKLLVVGDPDQISLGGVFQDINRDTELISRFLFDIPYKDSFSVTSSLFDLAKIRIPHLVQLNEHFRCVPEIIAFSNHYIYESKLKPLRYPHPKGLLSPALVPVLVGEGYQNTNNKVNEPEAEAIVEKLVECIEDPRYQKRPDGRICTFGIISLLAEDQAKHIKNLILKHPKLGEKVIEERNIVCGDSYAFQGDERDVIFLSMVRALDPNKTDEVVRPLVDKGASQRFNVAITRARDQVFLYHSIPLEEFRNQNDWRYRLLNWFYHPKIEELNAGRNALKREFEVGRASQFSVDVGNILIDRGYQVIPEYPVIGYRIDLVVQGSDARLAIECDGDQYHTLENWEADQIRESQLRRAGWVFWRVTGSSFYRYKEKALDSLWEKLDELGIKPIFDI